MSSSRARVGATNAIKVIASNSLAGSGSKLSDVSDVDTSTQAHRFVLTYNANTQKYEFVDPDVVLTSAASTTGTVIGSSGLPDAFLNALDTDTSRSANIDMDGGTW